LAPEFNSQYNLKTLDLNYKIQFFVQTLAPTPQKKKGGGVVQEWPQDANICCFIWDLNPAPHNTAYALLNAKWLMMPSLLHKGYSSE
jgi:hypothetical protein